jgi:thiamine pyrophosphate-dependent acetolactate synthase large subunit-like protein
MSAHQSRARGSAEILRFLEDHGHRHVFGLPGSSMVSTLYELQRSSIMYVPSVHESVAVAAADGYARVAGSAVCMLYMLPGMANGLANIHNAWRDETPLIILSSQQGSVYRTPGNTIGEADLVNLVKPFSRLAHELTPGMPIRRWLEAADRAAHGPPSGPVFLSITEDAMEQPGPVIDAPKSVRAAAGAPDVSIVAGRLSRAERPLIVVGGQLRRCGGTTAVEEIAKRWEIPVAYEVGFNDRLGVGPGLKHSVGHLLDAGARHARDADVVVLIGARSLLEAHPQPCFQKAQFLAQVNADPNQIETTKFVHWACACDPGAFAAALLVALTASPPQPDLLARRAAHLDAGPTPPSLQNPMFKLKSRHVKAVESFHDALDRGWVVDESVTAMTSVIQGLSSKDGARYMNTAGASLGWGTGAACGAALASGDPVTCVLGDGALRFGVQGLWTMKALNLPITLIVLDNGGYGSTRFFERQFVEGLGAGAEPANASYYGSDLRSGPGVADMIRGFGISCRTMSSVDDARAAVVEAWQKSFDGPGAVVIPIEYEG